MMSEIFMMFEINLLIHQNTFAKNPDSELGH